MSADIYTVVTNQIITQLESGVVPWKSPYFSSIGFPRNFSTGKEYRGINVFLLACQRFTSPYFLTFIQAKELGGNVRKGERGSLVVKYGSYSKQDEQAAGAEQEAADTRRFLKSYSVFNAAQIEGIEFPKPANLPELSITEKTELARQIVAGMPKAPGIFDGSAIPCYRPSTDTVHMPERGFFASEEAYYSVLFHELTHSTGHTARLARKSLLENKGIDALSDDSRKVYAEEELVAEMGAQFLNANAGIIEADCSNSAAYLQGWIDALKSKDARGWIIRAASQAQKAADYVLNIKEEA